MLKCHTYKHSQPFYLPFSKFTSIIWWFCKSLWEYICRLLEQIFTGQMPFPFSPVKSAKANAQNINTVLKYHANHSSNKSSCTSKVPSSLISSVQPQWRPLANVYEFISHIYIASNYTVPTCTVPMGNCTYGHRPPTTMNLHASFNLICCNSSWDIVWQKKRN